MNTSYSPEIGFEAFPKIARLCRECFVTEKIDGTNAQVFVWDEFAPDPEAVTPENPSPCAAMGAPPPGIPFLGRPGLGQHVAAGSRNRWLTLENDNYGFAKWVAEHAAGLAQLGHGRHFGEWWGNGIQRGYGVLDKRFSLFNVSRWNKALWDENEAARVIREIPVFAAVRRNKNQAIRSEDAPVARPFVPPPACCSVVPLLWRSTFDTQAISVVLRTLSQLGSQAAPGFMNPEGVVVYHAASRQLFKQTLERDSEPKGGAQ